MADRSGIEWTDATWNPIVGCSLVSPGCTNCYAMKMAARIEAMQPGSHYAGTTQPGKAGAVWSGKVALAPEHILTQPLRWRRPRRIFVNSMGDLLHEDVPDAWIDRVFAIMALSPQHTYQVLTKRSTRMREYFAETWQPALARSIQLGGGKTIDIPAEKRPSDRWDRINLAIDDVTMNPFFDHERFWTPEGSLIGRPAWPRRPLPNVWLGVSTEDQRRADERVPDLLATPAAIRFVSAEPLLGPLKLFSLREVRGARGTITDWHDSLRGFQFGPTGAETARIDLVIAGGESGPNARPMHPDWARSLRDQCATAGVPFFFKQWGEHVTAKGATGDVPISHVFEDGYQMIRVGKARAGRLLDGVEHNALPEVRS
ncbi:phage Gp37/Gp68 family protein [Ancylobacter sp. SL191]|uniref:phage Gp37/Gp68 family protein n=1 Tax=Ancylobacter sp. SL191 TaxID=2995166 RepID=UPI002271B359|nr:phage Gp37/Gp68 family protein [Ancylobacter sp. SL191]WAC26381.1 phage Gp37/Gp68 family protein [Ancylobacter sp. SL191]